MAPQSAPAQDGMAGKASGEGGSTGGGGGRGAGQSGGSTKIFRILNYK